MIDQINGGYKKPNRLILDLLVWVVYSVVAIIFTHPLVLHLTDRLPGEGSDSIQYYWFAWWDGWSLLHSGLNTFYCPYVFHPIGAYLNGEPLPFGLVFGLLSRVCPPVLVFNLLYLFLYVFSAWACYRLALYLWHRRDVGFLAGLIFGFSPYMLIHGTGHINMLNGGVVALTILCTLKVLDDDRFRLGHILAAGIWFGLLGLSSNYYFLYLSIWLIGLCIFLALKGKLGRAFWRIAFIVAVAVVIILPQMLATFRAFGSGYYRGVSTLGSAYMSSIDLFGVLVPSRMHPLWGNWVVKTFSFMGAGSIEKVCYLGIVVILLAILGWWHYRDRIWIAWIAIWTLGAWLFSLGPILQVLGRNTFIPLPGLVIVLTPLVNNARNSCRCTMLVTLGAALLVAGGIKWLLENKRCGKKFKWLWIPVSVWIIFEFLPIPYPTLTAHIPKQAHQLPMDPLHPVVLNLPLGRGDGFGRIGDYDVSALLLQTAHHRPIIGGYLTRMRSVDKSALKNGVLGDILHIQSGKLKSSPMNPRSERIREMVRKWYVQRHPLIHLLEIVAGKEKIQRILHASNHRREKPEIILHPESVVSEFDRLGVGYIIAISPSQPHVSVVLDYLSKSLDLSLLSEEGKYVFYRVNYKLIQDSTITARHL
ncbi:hypothetical protein AMJ86_06080 [bacterium SM23_57]|nr:MAG: hypothetical protein AMJ86_06080 [bacterium SM23_57]